MQLQALRWLSTKLKQHPIKVGPLLRYVSAFVVAALLVVVALSGFLQMTVVNGHSMLPTLRSGDVVITAKTNDYRKGDIVVYHPNSLLCSRCNVVHRIVKGSPTTFWIAQGDNRKTNPNLDPWQFHNNEIRGKVILVLPLAPVAPILESPLSWLALAALLVAVWMFSKAREAIKEDEKETEEIELIGTSNIEEEALENEKVH